MFGDITACLLDRLRSGLLADGVDVARLIREVGDVHVDEDQADLLQLGFERVLDVRQERVAILVDVLDAHRGDHLPELPEDDFLRLLLDIDSLETQQTNGRVVHDLGRRADRDGEDARHVDADVFG